MAEEITKKLDIIYFGDTRDINGVNLVTNILLLGKDRFRSHKIELSKIYSSNGVLDCSLKKSLPIGANLGTTQYKLIRVVRTILKAILDSRIPIFAWYKFRKNFLEPAKKVVENNYRNLDSDYVLFQDLYTAYFYYQNKVSTTRKSILVLHSEKDVFGQLKLLYPGIFKNRYKVKMDEILQSTLAAVDQVVFVSEKSANFNANISSKVAFVHNAIPDLESVKFKTGGELKFICVGSINYNKGQDVIIEAINLLPDNLKTRMNFSIVGDGPQLSKLKKKVANYNLEKQIHFLGLRNDVSEILREMDVLVLMSKTEGLPLSIIEGMRQGLYIVSTNVGGISEMLNDGFGKLIERHPQSLSDFMQRVLTENLINLQSKTLSRKNYLAKFTLDLMIDKYSHLFACLDRE